MTREKKHRTVLTINALTPQEMGICDEALHHGVKELKDVLDDLKVLPANFTQAEALLLLTLLSQLPETTQHQVRMLMNQLRAASFPVADSGTIIHIPPL